MEDPSFNYIWRGGVSAPCQKAGAGSGGKVFFTSWSMIYRAGEEGQAWRYSQARTEDFARGAENLVDCTQYKTNKLTPKRAGVKICLILS